MFVTSQHLALAVLLSSTALSQLLPTQLAPYFQVDEPLAVSFNGIDLTQPGTFFSPAETQATPLPEAPKNLSAPPPYLFVMVDPSYNATVPTNVVLHTIVGNLIASNNASGAPSIPSFTELRSSSPALAPYVGPEPAKGQSAHDYALLLFAQPAGFAVPAAFDHFLPLNLSNVYTRVNFPLLDFVRQTGLGQPVAANYFLSGSAAPRSNSTMGANSTTVANSTVPAATRTAAATQSSTNAAATAIVSSGAAASRGAGVLGVAIVSFVVLVQRLS